MLGSSIRLGKIAGIEISINFSLVFMALWVIYTLSAIDLPNRAPGYTENEYLIYSVLGATLFFGSILWHELAHALMAKLYHIRVRRIVLFFLGGVAEIEQEPRTATQEFWIAILGPVSSVVLGAIGILASRFLPDETLLGEVLFWIGFINILLAAFNMVPGFPLDGGRVLRAFLWWLTGNYLKATQWATYLGQAFAYMLLFLGLISLISPFALNGIMLILLGFFLLSAAKAQLRSAIVRAGLRGISIGHLVRQAMAVEATWPLTYAIDTMAMTERTSVVPVVNNGQWVGALSVENFRILPRLYWNNLRVQDAMTPIHRVQKIEAESDLYEALQNQDIRDQSYLLVTSNQQPVGLLSLRDMVNFVERRLSQT